MFILIVAMFAVGAFPLHAAPLSLSDAWQKASEYDSRLRAAQADHLINREEVGKARSRLRPNVQLSATRGRNSTEHTYLGTADDREYYSTANYGISLKVPLFSLSGIAGYQQSKLLASKSETDLQNEESGLVLRLVEAYCNALYAEENIVFSKVHIEASKEQLQQARRRFENGFGTVTEINEAQAGYDIALAEGLDIVNSLEYSRRELENLTGVYPDALCHLVPEKLQPTKPDPENIDVWISRALTSNLALTSARREIEIARKEIHKQRAARYPVLDFVAAGNYSESENNYSIGSTYDTYSVSLQMSLPIYTGGYVSASVRQAQAKWMKAGEQHNLQERNVESDVRRFYNGVVIGIARIQAYEQAVKAQEIAFEGTRKGYEAGFRSNVDVLDAQQKLFDSRRNLAKSRYQYIMNRLLLKQTTGALTIDDVNEVDSWLR